MTAEINFYQCDETIAKSIAPLILKILEENKKALILSSNPVQIQEIDGGLWTYGKNKFIPHIIAGDKDFANHDIKRQPIIISDKEENLNQADYLVFLNQPSDNFISKFSRAFYFFEEENFAKAQDLAKKLKPNNSYKKIDGKWAKFKF